MLNCQEGLVDAIITQLSWHFAYYSCMGQILFQSGCVAEVVMKNFNFV